jgi:hypothetical protein
MQSDKTNSIPHRRPSIFFFFFCMQWQFIPKKEYIKVEAE